MSIERPTSMIYSAVAAKSVNPRVRIIAVESERGPGFYTSLKGISIGLVVVFDISICQFQRVDQLWRNVNQL